jgi:hypothetical protein
MAIGRWRFGRSKSRGKTVDDRAERIRERRAMSRNCGRLMATADELFGAWMLVLGTDDGNVEGDMSAPAFVNEPKRSAWLLVRPPPGLHACVQPGE